MEKTVIMIESKSGNQTWYIDKGEKRCSIHRDEHFIKCVDTIGEALEYILIENLGAKEVKVIKNQ